MHNNFHSNNKLRAQYKYLVTISNAIQYNDNT